MKSSNKNIFIIFLVIISVVSIYFILLPKNKEKEEVISIEKTYSFSQELRDKQTEFTGKIQSIDDVIIYPESSGILRQVFVDEGQRVKEGQIIAQLENVNQRLAVKKAQISLDAERIQLQKMQNNNELTNVDSVLSRIVDSQNSTINSLKSSYLNTDLRAYPEDYDESDDAPIISGSYTCDTEGEYVVDVYGSAADSGASFSLSGLEQGRESVSVHHAVPLGGCGLEIVFPRSFGKNKKWIIPIPNTRSSEYLNAKKNYESALSGKNLAIKQGSVDEADINHQKKIISQASLTLESMQVALSKTIIRAPFDGLIYKKYIDAGRLVSPTNAIFAMNSPNLEIVAFVSLEKAKNITVGKPVKVYIDGHDHDGSVRSIVQSFDNNSQSLKISFVLNGAPHQLIPGSLVKIIIQNKQDQVFAERDFIGFGYDGPFINCQGKSIPVKIEGEETSGYWLNSTNTICNDEILLPHLIEKVYE